MRLTIRSLALILRVLIDHACILKTLVCMLTFRDCIHAARDHAWFLLSLLLRPFVRTPGFVERRCFARALRIDPPQFKVEVQAVETCMVNDGKTTLRGTLWLPAGAAGPWPAVIIRSPYGAQNQNADWGNIVLAERGYAVLFQDTRGRFGSDGQFVPVEHERGDGKETVRWVREQPWCDGRIAVFGPSYLGLTAWACVGACEPGEIQAAVPIITRIDARASNPSALTHVAREAAFPPSRFHSLNGRRLRALLWTEAAVRSAVFSEAGAISHELLVLWFYLIEV